MVAVLHCGVRSGREARVDEIIEGAEVSGVEGRDNKRAAEDQSDAGEFRAFRFT